MSLSAQRHDVLTSLTASVILISDVLSKYYIETREAGVQEECLCHKLKVTLAWESGAAPHHLEE